jgi:hypothetical protein
MAGDGDSDSERALGPEGKKANSFSQAWSLLSNAIDNYGCGSLWL